MPRKTSLNAAIAAWVLAGVAPPSGAVADSNVPGGAGVAARSTEYAGSKACKSCHESIFADWTSSAHAQAMREARPADGSSGSAGFGKDGASRVEFAVKDGAPRAQVSEAGTGPKNLGGRDDLRFQ